MAGGGATSASDARPEPSSKARSRADRAEEPPPPEPPLPAPPRWYKRCVDGRGAPDDTAAKRCSKQRVQPHAVLGSPVDEGARTPQRQIARPGKAAMDGGEAAGAAIKRRALAPFCGAIGAPEQPCGVDGIFAGTH